MATMVGSFAIRRNAEIVAVLRVVDVERVVIEGRQRAHHARPSPPSGARRGGSRWYRRASCSCTMVWCVTMSTNSSFCLLVRQLAVQQQVADLEEVAVLRELLDRVAAVEQHARRRRRCR